MTDDPMFLRVLDKSDKIVETLTKAGVALVGYNANNHWSGALTALVALKLAQSPNLASGIAGTGTLGVLGLLNVAQLPNLSNMNLDPLIIEHQGDRDWWGNYGFQRAWG